MKSYQPRTERDNQFRYDVYGLSVISDMEIPELAPASREDPDVWVALEDVPESLPHALSKNDWLEFSESSCLLKIPKVGRLLIENGDSIRVDRREDRDRQRGNGTRMTDLRVYLLGSAFGALLHQRGWLPLHVSAIQAGESVWAFSGDSGAGKSTLAAFLHRRFGYPIVSDDVSVLSPEDKEPLLHPGPRKLKLWRNAIDQLGFRRERLIQDLQSSEKYQLYLEDRTIRKPSRMRGLIILDRSDDDQPSRLEPLYGMSAFQAVASAIYRPSFGRAFRTGPELMKDVARLADSIEVYRLRRQWSLDAMAHELKPLLDLMGTQEGKFGT